MAVLQFKLPEHVRDVVLDGVGTDAEAHGDLRVRPALAQLPEHPPLGRREDVWVARPSAAAAFHASILPHNGEGFPTRSGSGPAPSRHSTRFASMCCACSNSRACQRRWTLPTCCWKAPRFPPHPRAGHTVTPTSTHDSATDALLGQRRLTGSALRTGRCDAANVLDIGPSKASRSSRPSTGTRVRALAAAEASGA